MSLTFVQLSNAPKFSLSNEILLKSLSFLNRNELDLAQQIDHRFYCIVKANERYLAMHIAEGLAIVSLRKLTSL